jgi:hypothetical protein
MSKRKGQLIEAEGFADKELNPLVKEPSIVKVLDELARERYPRHNRIALRCLQAGFSLALDVVKQDKEKRV